MNLSNLSFYKTPRLSQSGGFVLEFDKDDKKLMSKMVFLKNICDYIYVVTDNSKKRKELTNKIPNEYGLLCYSDSFGHGYAYQLFREAKTLTFNK